MLAIIYRLSMANDCRASHGFISGKVEPTRDQLYRKAKTGDLLGVAYTTFHGKLVKIFTASMWTHVCMVIELRDDEIEVNNETGNVLLLKSSVKSEKSGRPRLRTRKYVVEMARYSSAERGVIIKPMTRWLDWNSRRTIAWRPYSGHHFPSHELKQVIYSTQEASENMNVATWLRTMKRSRYAKGTRDSYYCTEYIGMLLQESCVSYKRYDPGSHQPWEMVYGNFLLMPEHSYSKPHLLSYE